MKIKTLALAVPFAALATISFAQTLPASLVELAKISSGEPANFSITADDTGVGMLICYTGTGSTGGTVTVAANGDITLSTAPVGGSAVDTTVECPLAAPYGGIIDVSDPLCNTFGEIANIINSTTNSWRAVLVDVLASDDADDAGGMLIDRAETAANDCDAGLPLYLETSVFLNERRALLPPAMRKLGAAWSATRGSACATSAKRASCWSGPAWWSRRPGRRRHHVPPGAHCCHGSWGWSRCWPRPRGCSRHRGLHRRHPARSSTRSGHSARRRSSRRSTHPTASRSSSVRRPPEARRTSIRCARSTPSRPGSARIRSSCSPSLRRANWLCSRRRAGSR